MQPWQTQGKTINHSEFIYSQITSTLNDISLSYDLLHNTF